MSEKNKIEMTVMMRRLEEFHKAFNLPIGKDAEIAKKDRQRLHFDLLIEEVTEYQDAYNNNDIVKIADALGDVLFVLISAVIENGLQDIFPEIFEEICDSNMSKLDENGKPIYREDGKVLKSREYFPPKINGIIARYKDSIKSSGGEL